MGILTRTKFLQWALTPYLLVLFACDAAPISVMLDLDTGVGAGPGDATMQSDANNVNDDTGTVIDTGTPLDASEPMDTGIHPDATVVMDSGIHPDAAVAIMDAETLDSGVHPDAQINPDAETLDGAPAEDATVVDTGSHPDAETLDTGIHPDAETPLDVGFAQDAVVVDSGIHPDAEVPDTGVIPDSGSVPSTRMSFFVTGRTVEVSGTPVTGGDLNGLAGADAFCLLLAREADSTDNRSWRAFLSTSSVDARDRIGTGPWYNALNQLIANDVNSLISNPPATNMIYDEQGRTWNGGNSTRHDILTGSNHDGRRFTSLSEMETGHPNPNGSLFTFPDGSFTYANPSAAFDFSCADWTTNAGGINSANYAVIGHVDWSNLAQGTGSDEWIASHVTACDQAEMNLNGGDMRLYCFAEN